MVFRAFMTLLYACGLLFVLAVLVYGLPYYLMPVVDRPHAPEHDLLKPAGLWGHGLGVIGTAMILLLFLYSARKREILGLRWGPMNRWLSLHIFCGIMGPLLVTLHTAMKFHGIVSISYFSMMAVMLSGIFGRYIYIQIPRDASGHAMSLSEIRRREEELAGRLGEEFGLGADALRRIRSLGGGSGREGVGVLRALVRSAVGDLVLPVRLWKLRRYVRRHEAGVPDEVLGHLMGIVREQSVLRRRIAFLDSMKAIFHLWHVIHKPFAYVMLVILLVHVAVTVALGYTWIF
jgi:hypothetical protein